MTDQGLGALASGCKALRSVNLSGHDQITAAGIAAVVAANSHTLVSLELFEMKMSLGDLATIITASTTHRHIGYESKIYEMNIESQKMYPLMRRFPKVLFVTCFLGLVQFPPAHLTAEIKAGIAESKQIVEPNQAAKSKIDDICYFANE